MNYYKDHKPTPEQLQAVEREDKIRKASCERILLEHKKKKEAERKQKSLLIPKTKKK